MEENSTSHILITTNNNSLATNVSSSSFHALSDWNYIFVAYITPPLMILLNFPVVISSGLILKKVQRKTMYLLLGNMSLADLIIGIATILRGVNATQVTRRSNPFCILQIGSLLGPTIVSTLTVALIAIDRYIFILHGMYYQRWITTSRVRWSIVWTWVIGMSLVLLPVTGWRNDATDDKCLYLSIYPRKLILLILFSVIIPVCITPVLYVKIVIIALHNLKSLQNLKKSIKKPKNNIATISGITVKIDKVDEVCGADSNKNNIKDKKENNIKENSSHIVDNNSDAVSINSFQTTVSEITSSTTNTSIRDNPTPEIVKNRSKNKAKTKYKGIVIVILTTGTFLVTLVPVTIVEIIFILSNDVELCNKIRYKIRGPLSTLTIFNQLLNPLIYAWWHEGMQRFIKSKYTLVCTKIKNKFS